MWRTDRRRPARTVATLAVALALAVGTAAPAAARTDPSQDPGLSELTITVKIDLKGDATPAILNKWKAAFKAYWEAMNGTVVCSRKLKFVLDMKIESGRSGAEQITVHTVTPGTHHISNVVGGIDDPMNSDRSGTWSSNAGDPVVAHEIGHILGLPDEYVYIDANGNGTRDPTEVTRPDTSGNPPRAPEYKLMNDWNGNRKVDFGDTDGDGKLNGAEKIDVVSLRPGKTKSLMAENPAPGKGIQKRHLEQIAGKHGAPCSKAWQGSIEGTLVVEGDGIRAEYVFSVDLRLREVEITPLTSPTGRVIGSWMLFDQTGTMSSTYTWTSTEGLGTCVGEGSVTLGAGRTLSILAVRTGDGDTTAQLGWDVPSEGSVYQIGLDMPSDATFPSTCSFGETFDISFPYPLLGRLPNEDAPVGSDPELRGLQENGTVMAGSYSVTYQYAGDTLTMAPTWRFVAEEGLEPGVGAIESRGTVAALDSGS